MHMLYANKTIIKITVPFYLLDKITTSCRVKQLLSTQDIEKKVKKV